MGLPRNLVIQALLYNDAGEYELAYGTIKKREAYKNSPKDSLFNADWMHDYGFLFQYSICTYYLGQYQESINACDHTCLRV